MNKQNRGNQKIDLIVHTIEKGLIIDAVNIITGIVVSHSENKKALLNLKDFVQSFAESATPDEKELYQKEFDKRIDEKMINFNQQLSEELSVEEVKDLNAALRVRINKIINGKFDILSYIR